MKNKKYLPLYYKWMNTGLTPEVDQQVSALCDLFDRTMITNQANPESRHYFDWNNRRWYSPTFLLLRDFREYFKIEAKINPIRDGQNNARTR